ncbi:hypothetical protein [Natrinema thermotolerans]
MSTETDSDEPRVSRRAVLRASAVTGVATSAGLGTIALAGVAAASHADSKPNSVTLTYDEATLRRYRPMLDLQDVSYANRPTLRGWVATSPDEETMVCIYACEYAKQESSWYGFTFDLTSHSGDHEWIYVVVDDSGDIVETDYTAYHWLRGRESQPTIYEDSDGPHPVYRVDGNFHHYYPLGATEGELLEVESLGDPETQTGGVYSWLDNGMEKDLRRGAVHNPWLMVGSSGYSDWWTRQGLGWKNQLITTAYAAGIAGAETADRGDL